MTRHAGNAAPRTGAGAGPNGRSLHPQHRELVPLPSSPPPNFAEDSGAELKARRNGGWEPADQPLLQPQVWERVRKLAVRQLNRLVSLEPKVLRDEYPEAVHDLRVASRRLQSLLDFLYPAPRPPQIRKLRRRLKQAREVLGDLRNQDVLAARMARVLARKRAARREAWQAGYDYVLKQRLKTVELAHRELTRLNLAQVYVRLREELSQTDRFATSSPAQAVSLPAQGPTGVPAEQTSASKGAADAAARFAERLGKLWRDFDALAAKSRRERGVLHALRIAAKRLRYLVEIAAALDVAGSSDALRWLRELQGKLGDWHDLEVLDETLIEMLARRKFLRGNLSLAIAIEKLILNLRASKTRQCHRYLRRAFQSSAYRQTAGWVNQSAALRLPAAV